MYLICDRDGKASLQLKVGDILIILRKELHSPGKQVIKQIFISFTWLVQSQPTVEEGKVDSWGYLCHNHLNSFIK